MNRTEEQRKTDSALTQAILDVRKAYDEEGHSDGFLMTDYIVISVSTKFDSDGSQYSAIDIQYRDSEVPLWRALGLIEYARARIKKAITSDIDEDDDDD